MTKFTKTKAGGFAAMKKGINTAADIVVSTMGPHGQNVAIAFPDKMPLVSRDGATVISSIKLEDEWLRLGSDMLVDAAKKTEHEAGDATTTTCAIVQGILNNLPSTFNRRLVCDELRLLSKEIELTLNNLSMKVHSDGVIDMEILRRLAITSANNDIELGTMIADLIGKIGVGGVIQVHESDDNTTYTEIKKGYNWKEGALSPHFLPNGSQPVTIEHPLILLIEEKVTDQKTLIPILESWTSNYHKNGAYTRSLVLIVSDLSGSAVDMLVENHKKGVPCIAIKCPETGIQRVESMVDIQLVTGTKQVFSEYTGNPLNKFGKDGKASILSGNGVEEFGECVSIKTDLRETVLYFEESDEMKQNVEEHIESLDQVDLDTEDRKQFYRERKSKLRNGIGHIYVGGDSKTEMYNKGLTVDDSQLACFAALEEGVLIGGGNTLVSLANIIKDSKLSVASTLSKALIHPFNILMSNSGVERSFFDKLFNRGYSKYYDKDRVFNVKTLKWEDTGTTVVLDAAKATKNAIRNAISVSIEVINTDHLIQWKND